MPMPITTSETAIAGPRQRTKSMCVSPMNCRICSLLQPRFRSKMSKITRATYMAVYKLTARPRISEMAKPLI